MSHWKSRPDFRSIRLLRVEFHLHAWKVAAKAARVLGFQGSVGSVLWQV